MDRPIFDISQIPVIDTARLRLRGVTERDLDPLAAMFADPSYMRFFGDGKTASRGTAWRTIAGVLGHWALRGYGLFAVDEQESGRFVGWTGLLYPEGWPAIEIAWGITAQRLNKGFATEAATAVRNYAFATLRIPRLVSLIHPDNSASIRVAEKIGERFDHVLVFEGKTVRLYTIASPE